MIGIGITPEGIFQNYAVYEFVLEQAWNRHKVDVSRWLEQYALARYGFSSEHLDSAWRRLHVSIVQHTVFGCFLFDAPTYVNIIYFCVLSHYPDCIKCSKPSIRSTDSSI